MRNLTLKSLVQLDLAALALVLLTFPYTFLFSFPHTRPHPFLWVTLWRMILLLAPAILGYTVDIRVQRRIHRGILNDEWTRTQLDATAGLFSERVRFAFHGSVILLWLIACAIFLLPHSARGGANPHLLAVYAANVVASRFESLRRQFISRPVAPAEPLWTNLAPLRSAHWGNR